MTTERFRRRIVTGVGIGAYTSASALSVKEFARMLRKCSERSKLMLAFAACDGSHMIDLRDAYSVTEGIERTFRPQDAEKQVELRILGDNIAVYLKDDRHETAKG